MPVIPCGAIDTIETEWVETRHAAVGTAGEIIVGMVNNVGM